MPHTNNPQAAQRKANRAGRKPSFLQKKAKPQKLKADHDPDLDAAGLLLAPVPKISDDSSREEKVRLIQLWHTIEKQLAAPEAASDPSLRAKLLAKQNAMGGLAAYQAASVHGGDKQRGGETGKWCVKQLQELKVGVDKGKQKEKVEPTILPDGTKQWPKPPPREKLRLLDVGAIGGTSYNDWKWIDVTSIDLNPQAKHVQKYDFFDFPLPKPDDKLYDVVGLSLVLNFVGDLKKRAEMIRRTHSFLKPAGLLYIVLPLPCLTNSRYLNHERWTSILATLGFAPVRQHDSAKLTFWLLKRTHAPDSKVWKREEVRGGVHRNNFTIVVGGGEGDEEEWNGIEEKAEGEDEEWGGIEEGGAKMDEEWGGIQEGGPEDEEWNGIQ